MSYYNTLKYTGNLLHKEALTKMGEEKEGDQTDLYQFIYIKVYAL